MDVESSARSQYTMSSTRTSTSYCALKWMEALEICRRNLNYQDDEVLDQIKSYDALLDSLDQLQETLHASKITPLRQLLYDSLLPLRSFITLLAAALGTTTIRTAIIWGIMSLVIQAAGNTQTLLPKTVDMLKDLGHDLEIFQIYELTFAQNIQMSNELMDVFVEIITFWTQAIHSLRRNKHSQAAQNIWPQFHKTFEESSRHIRKRSQQIKEKLEVLTAVQTRSDANLLKELDRLGLITSGGALGTGSENNSLFPCDNIPFTPNPNFCGRDEELVALRAYFEDTIVTTKFRSFALYGAGGIGKTQIALHFAHQQAGNTFEAVLWLNCETGLSIAQSFYEIADMLQLEGLSQNVNTNQNRFLVLKWLRRASIKWLVVMDNVEDLTLIRSAWPVAPQGAVLVTSRNSIVSIDPAAAGMEIKVFEGDEGSKVLINFIGRSTYSPKEIISAQRLSERLGGLPLALAIMASQIRIRNTSISEFLKLYNKHSRELSTEKRGIEMYYNMSLASCWQTAFDFLTPEAGKLLGIIALIAPDHIPEALFRQTDLPSDLSFCHDDWAFGKALEGITSTSLIRQDPQTGMIYVHRVIQEQFLSYVGKDRRRALFVTASELLNNAFPTLVNGLSMRRSWKQCKLYSAHVLFLCARYEEDKFTPVAEDEFGAFLELSISVGWYLLECGAWEEEFELMRTALYICEDKEGLVYAALANSVGGVECERGHVAASHDFMDQALSIRQRLLPPDHPEVANCLNNYANILLQNLDNGDCEKALDYYNKCIAINMKCAPEHRNRFLHIPHTNIARLLRITKDYAGSIEHAELSRQYSVNSLGPQNHFDGLADYHIGNAHFDQGHYDEAERYWKRALTCFEKESDTHPITSAAKLKLCCILLKKGRYATSIDDLSKLVIIAQLNERAKGDKGETARMMRKLAEAYTLNGDVEKGAGLRDEAEMIRKEIQGSRFDTLPDEDQSYAMMSFHAFW